MANAKKPTSLKVLQGTARKDRTNELEPQPAADALKPPSYMSAGAKKHWRDAVKHLEAAKIVANTDIGALVLFCEKWCQWIDAKEALASEGLIIMSPNGYPMPSPWVSIERNAFDQVRKMMIEFGMTPSSRSKVNVTEKVTEEDSVSEYRSRRTK